MSRQVYTTTAMDNSVRHAVPIGTNKKNKVASGYLLGGNYMNNWESKCFNRRTLLVGAAGALPLIALGATSAKAASKLTQSSVRYQAQGTPEKHCGICNFFVAPSSCKQVDGTINPNGVCTLWVAKA